MHPKFIRFLGKKEQFFLLGELTTMLITPPSLNPKSTGLFGQCSIKGEGVFSTPSLTSLSLKLHDLQATQILHRITLGQDEHFPTKKVWIKSIMMSL